MHPFRCAALLALLLAAPIAARAADATTDSAANAAPCKQSIGADKAAVLVKQCLEVSPATHPPCNAENACDLISDEIARGCAMIDKNAPAFCAKQAGPAH